LGRKRDQLLAEATITCSTKGTWNSPAVPGRIPDTHWVVGTKGGIHGVAARRAAGRASVRLLALQEKNNSQPLRLNAQTAGFLSRLAV
jgi:hypothetical protein